VKLNFQIAVAILLIGASYAGYQIYTFYTEDIPKMVLEKQKLDVEITSKEAELKKLQDFAQNIETIKQQLKELNIQLESALEYMPRSFSFSSLLRKLTMLAQNSGVELSSFHPKKGEEKKDSSFYSTASIDFDLKGTFTQTLVFLDQLSRLKRIVSIEDLRLKANDIASTQRTGNIMVSTAASIKTYRFTE